MKSLISFFFIVIAFSCFSQDVETTTIKYAAKKTAKEMTENVLNYNKTYQVIVMPFTTCENNIDTEGEKFSKKIASNINELLNGSTPKFNVISYYELNNQTIDSIKKITTIHGYQKSSDYWEQLSEINNVHFFITGCYCVKDNYFNFENIRIDYNSTLKNVPENESFSIANVSAKKVINQNALYRSIIPGIGQFYKERKVKGFIFITTVPLFLSTAYVMGVLQNKYEKKYSSNPTQPLNDKIELFKSLKKFSYLTLGTVYAINLIDAYISKPKLLNNNLTSSLNIYPEFNNGICLGLNYNF